MMPSEPTEIEELFHRARALEPGARADFLGAISDPSLRGRVQKLLAAAAEAEDSALWKQPAILHEARATLEQHHAEKIDRYRLLDPIGSGGMGVVYKAVRDDDAFSKIVAVKIVHAAPENPEILRRFLQERRILAGLEHPHIARLLDGGATAQGLPFLVMEYVDGAPIARYIADRNPSVAERLELFLKICGAVSCAHRNLIVHRDLKPANILVTDGGEPKLLDFGIAKLLDGTADRTRTGAGGMTPEYASPEQVRGAPITTATDIYSLGVLLYEILSGSRPYRPAASAMQLAQAITVDDPRPLGPGIDSDLETIVHMSMRKEPERRYASVEHLADDIRRYRRGYPVLARPDSRVYRLRKFAARNKAGIAAAALVAMAIGIGGAATLREERIASRRFNDVRKLANSYLFEFHDAIKDLPGATPARKLVVTRALEYLDSLSRERGNDIGLSRELASAYEKIGDLQGEPGAVSLGDRIGALGSYRKALAIRESLPHADPKIAAELGANYAKTGSILAYTGDIAGAVLNYRKGIAILEKAPATTEVREALALTDTLLADALGNSNYQNLGDSKSAIQLYREVLALRGQLAAEDPANVAKLTLLAAPYSRLGQLLQSQGDKAGAVTAYRRAVDLSDQASRRQPDNAVFRRALALSLRNLALSLSQMNNASEALEAGDRAYQLLGQLSRDDPKNVEARIELADGTYAQGYLRKTAQPAQAVRFYTAAITSYQQVLAEHPGQPPPGLRTAYQLLADASLATGDAATAIASAQHELSIDDLLLRTNSANASAERSVGMARRQIARAHELIGIRESQIAQFRSAREWYRRSLDIFQAQKAKGTLIPAYAAELIETPKAIARCDLAIASLAKP